MSLERIWLQAWIDGLSRRADAPAVRPVEPFAGLARLDGPTPRHVGPQRGPRA